MFVTIKSPPPVFKLLDQRPMTLEHESRVALDLAQDSTGPPIEEQAQDSAGPPTEEQGLDSTGLSTGDYWQVSLWVSAKPSSEQTQKASAG